MKTIAKIIVVMASLSSLNAFPCDEACRREAAETTHNVEFPSYITWRYCDDVSYEFMTSAIRSLSEFRNTNLNTKYKGPIKNTRAFLKRHKSWLEECDKYLSVTGKNRIFKDDETTNKIFTAIDGVLEELDALVAGVTYSTSTGSDNKTVIHNKFDRLFSEVTSYKDYAQARGKYVYR